MAVAAVELRVHGLARIAFSCGLRASSSSDPDLVFRLLEFVARHGIDVSADVERRLSAAARRYRESSAGAAVMAEFEDGAVAAQGFVCLRLMHVPACWLR